MFAEYVIGLFASGFAGGRLTLAIDLMKILSLSLLFGSVLQLTQARLSGLGKIEWSYILVIFPQLLQVCVLLYASLRPTTVHWAALSQTVGQALSMLVGLLVVKPAFNRSLHSAEPLQRIFVSSFRVRAAHNIHNFFSLYIINSTLSLLPTHFASVFILIKRVADTFLAVITGPLQRVLTNEFGAAMHSGMHVQIRSRLRSLDLQLPVLFGAVLAGGWAVGFAISLGKWVDAEELRYGLICFTILMVQTALIATEIPYALVSLALHRSLVFYLSNTIFLIAFISALILFKNISLSLALPASLTLAQFFNFFIIRHAAHAVLKARCVSA